MNITKTELFTAGLDQSESAAIASYGFPCGQFPIRYLGLPLMSRKLKISEYAPLMIKISLFAISILVGIFCRATATTQDRHLLHRHFLDLGFHSA